MWELSTHICSQCETDPQTLQTPRPAMMSYFRPTSLLLCLFLFWFGVLLACVCVCVCVLVCCFNRTCGSNRKTQVSYPYPWPSVFIAYMQPTAGVHIPVIYASMHVSSVDNSACPYALRAQLVWRMTCTNRFACLADPGAKYIGSSLYWWVYKFQMAFLFCFTTELSFLFVSLSINSDTPAFQDN